MLIIYRKAIISSLLMVVCLFSTFFIPCEEWGFALRVVGCFLGFLVIIHYQPDAAYYNDIEKALANKMGKNSESFYISELHKEQDWKTMLYVPAGLVSAASGFILCPSFNYGVEPGIPDVICIVVGFATLLLSLRQTPFKDRKQMISSEVDKLYWRLK